jgi:hypothetical protein
LLQENLRVPVSTVSQEFDELAAGGGLQEKEVGAQDLTKSLWREAAQGLESDPHQFGVMLAKSPADHFQGRTTTLDLERESESLGPVPDQGEEP